MGLELDKRDAGTSRIGEGKDNEEQVVGTSQYFKHSVRKDEIEVRVRRREDRGVDCKRIWVIVIKR